MKLFKNIFDAVEAQLLFQNSELFMRKVRLYISNPEKKTNLVFGDRLTGSFSASDFPCTVLLSLFLHPDFLSNLIYGII